MKIRATYVVPLLVLVGLVDSSTARAFTLNEIPVCVNLLLADINADCQTDYLDLEILNQNFGRTVPPHKLGDLNGDRVVNAADLSILVANFGKSCECVDPNPPTCP